MASEEEPISTRACPIQSNLKNRFEAELSTVREVELAEPMVTLPLREVERLAGELRHLRKQRDVLMERGGELLERARTAERLIKLMRNRSRV